MKDKILNLLKSKYTGIHSSLLGLVADKLSVKVTKEEEIEGAISELDNMIIPVSEYAKLLQTEGDRRVSDAINKIKSNPQQSQNQPSNQQQPQTTEPAKTGSNGKKSRFSELVTLIKQQNEQIEALKTSFVTRTLNEKVTSVLESKKIAKSFYEPILNGKTFNSAEEIDTTVQQIEESYNVLKQELVNQGLSASPKPFSAVEQPNNSVLNDIKSWSEANAPKQK